MRTTYCENRNGATLQNVIFRTASPFPNARLLGLGRLPNPAAWPFLYRGNLQSVFFKCGDGKAKPTSRDRVPEKPKRGFFGPGFANRLALSFGWRLRTPRTGCASSGSGARLGPNSGPKLKNTGRYSPAFGRTEDRRKTPKIRT